MKPEGPSLRVLAIDDDEEDLIALSRSLKASGAWSVEFFGHTGTKDAIEKLNTKVFDIIFLDYLLVNETGLDVLKRIRLTEINRPVIVMTGQGDEYLAVEMIQNGANGYLSKSDMKPDVLRVVIDSVMRECELEREKLLLEQKLRESQKMEAIGTLAGGIAHDFNNILTGILGEVELAMLHAEGHATHPHLESIGKACHRMSEVIRRLLTFSRRGATELRATDLREVVSEVMVILEHSLPKEITLVTELTDAPAYVQAAESGMEQILLNLCTNARDAMPDGGVITLRVTVVDKDDPRAAVFGEPRAERYVLLEVEDNGAGIEDAVLDRMFEPFYTTKKLGSRKGTGLGLAVVWQLVEECRGRIAVESVLGQGTTFRILFDIPTTLPPLDEAPHDTAMPRGTETVLVVDDEATLRDVLSRMLKHLGYTAVTAANGTEALEIATRRREEIGLVILDMSMPGMNGLKCFESLRLLVPEMPVIFASGHDMKRHEDTLRAAGAAHVLQKPFVLADIARHVRLAIDARKTGPNG